MKNLNHFKKFQGNIQHWILLEAINIFSKTCYEVVLRSSYGRREINVCADSRQVETNNGFCLLLNFTKSIINAKTDKSVRLILKNHDSKELILYILN